MPAPVAEKIVRIDVREGQQVAAGAALLQLELTRTQSQLAAVQAQAQQSREALSELEAGPRREDIAQATRQRRRRAGAGTSMRALITTACNLSAGRSWLPLRTSIALAPPPAMPMRRYARRKRRCWNWSAVRAANRSRRGAPRWPLPKRRRRRRALSLDKLNVVAPRAGRVDSLPYKLGDQAPVGSPLAILLVGDAPYARVYVPEPIRAQRQGRPSPHACSSTAATARFHGRVRMIRSEPSFTPYYALSGRDAQRLSYLAEITLDKAGADLPAGVPVRVEFEGTRACKITAHLNFFLSSFQRKREPILLLLGSACQVL